MTELKQETITIDVPVSIRGRMERLTQSLCLTRIRAGNESPNLSETTRILLEISLDNRAGFLKWSKANGKPDKSVELSRFNFQVPDKTVLDIDALGAEAGIVRLDEGLHVTNLTQTIIKMLAYPLEDEALISDWFRKKIHEGMVFNG